ncbi:penicillin-binding protein 1A [Temperatibacter marinus]|uniref:Penicillin-binding protein 1A n=1 Tax=Temperatibacter marinus TaxID=1456591 RepID=A0AA52ECQ3_9PROT|nr:penicillin-binding protein 1A [Temperatibacter marinus]WND02280.1 penicillin-binding protein 1A [Temperatibacter marinus]
MTETEKLETSMETQKGTPKPAKRALWFRMILWSFWLGLTGTTVAVVGIISLLLYYRNDLPDYRQLADYEPSVATRVHAGDGSMIAEFATEKRLFVPINAIPEPLIQAFLAAEDKNFYTHSGLDYMGMVRANIRNVYNLMKGRALAGGSTISQQVAKNFLLTLDQRLDRKMKEIILTLRIEKAYTKDRILELYLNEIYFGNGSYGVASAALNYFDKALNQLTLAERAYLAAVIKGPSNYHPLRNNERGIARRNWVLSRMRVLNYISEDEYRMAAKEPLIMTRPSGATTFKADYYEEEVRRQIKGFYGDKKLYQGGLSVRTALEPKLQAIAEQSLRSGLVNYDRRHGWRGPLLTISVEGDWPQRLKNYSKPLGMPSWENALVHEVREDGVIIGLIDGRYGFIPMKEIEWARPWLPRERVGRKPTHPGQVVAIGNVIAVHKLASPALRKESFIAPDGGLIELFPQYSLQQVPDVEGALVAMDPHTGRVLALVGGYDYKSSQYNRATQAKRQPGSAFKPFVYGAALEQDFTPSSLVLDAPFVIDQGEGRGKWKPRNSSNKFYGPSTLRLGIEKSRNLMTVRLAQHLGMRNVINYAQKFDLADNLEPTLAGSLGAGEVTLIDLTAAYGTLVNGGHKISPIMIDRIQDRRGRTIYPYLNEDEKLNQCPGCNFGWELSQREPNLPEKRERVIDGLTSYQLVSMMEGVATRGTARSLKWRVPNQSIGGKTGTTNRAADLWFVGFSADLVVGVFVGFDRPRSLGEIEEGSTVPVPIFADFMKKALEGKPAVPLRIPSGIHLVRVDSKTGQPAGFNDKNVIWEAFKPGTEPRLGKTVVLDGAVTASKEKKVKKGTGGIY